MDKAFLNWYTQSLGGVIGLIACMLAYLNGYIAIYGKILKNIDSIGITGVISSFLLVPLCLVLTILGFLEGYLKNEKIIHINKIIVITTIIIGFLGSKFYFIIPTTLILYKYYPKIIKEHKKNTSTQVITDSKVIKKNISHQELQKKKKLLAKTRIDIAVELLIKGADKAFICEITGLTKEAVDKIEQRIK